MEKLKKLVELAEKADAAASLMGGVNPRTILAIAEAFSALEQRAEAADAEVKHQLNVNALVCNDHQKNVAERNALRAKLAELGKQKPDLISHLEHCSEIVSRWPDWKKKGADAAKFIQSLDEFEIGYLNGHTEAFRNRPAPAISLAELVPDEIKIAVTEGVRHGIIDGEIVNPHRADGWNACRAAILRNIEGAK